MSCSRRVFDREGDFLRSLDAYLTRPYTEREGREERARARQDGPGFVTCQGCLRLIPVDERCGCVNGRLA